MSFLLEIAVESVDAAVAAERAGADRIELCANLSVGGLTPSPEMMRHGRAALRIPVFAMIRPRPGDFVYSDAEFFAMQEEIARAREAGMDGVVLGMLSRASTEAAPGLNSKSVDVERTGQLVELARPMSVTFHRAFDELPNQAQALEDVISTGANRLLTSGGARSAADATPQLRNLVEAAGNRIIIMPGAGLHAGNFAQVRAATHARELHSGLGGVLAYGSRDLSRFESEIRKMKFS